MAFSAVIVVDAGDLILGDGDGFLSVPINGAENVYARAIAGPTLSKFVLFFGPAEHVSLMTFDLRTREEA